MKRIIYLLPLLLILQACGAPSQATQPQATEPPVTEPVATEPLATQPPVDDSQPTFSSDTLGICFSYPEGYTQVPYNDTVEIVAPEIPGFESRGVFWLTISPAYDRTAEVIAEQDLSMTPGLNPGRSTVTLGGEEGVVLDGMPGQDFVRNVYVVHGETLFLLTFTPTLSDIPAAEEQMEALFSAVTSSWTWAPCSAGE